MMTTIDLTIFEGAIKNALSNTLSLQGAQLKSS
jgi:hypothetical protein